MGPDGERGIVIMVSSSAAVRDTTIPLSILTRLSAVRSPAGASGLRRLKRRNPVDDLTHGARSGTVRHTRGHHRAQPLRVPHD